MKPFEFTRRSVRNLQTKLALLLLVPTALIVAGLLVLFRQNLNQAFFQQYVEEGLLLSSVVEQRLAFYGELPDNTAIEEILEQDLRERPSYAQLALFGPRGELVARVSNGPPVNGEMSADADVMGVFSSRSAAVTVEPADQPGATGKLLETASPIMINGRVVAVLESYRPLDASQLMVDQLMREVEVAGPSGIAVLIVMLFAGISYLVIRPVRQLQRAAEEIAKGHYTLRLPVSGADELARLAGAFNQMAQSVETSMQQQKGLNAQLATLNTIAAELARSLDLPFLLDRLAEGIGHLVGAEGVIIYLIDPQSRQIRRVHTRGVEVEEAGRTGDVREKGLFGLSIRTRQSLMIEDVRDHPSVAETPPHQPPFGTLLLLPLAAGDTPFGVVVAGRPADAAPFQYADLGAVQSLVLFGSTAIEKALLYEQSQELAVTDGLTGLFNHREFQRRLNDEMERNQRYGHPFSLLLVDIDHFKLVNDHHGHLAGDAVLRALAGSIQDSIRMIDIAARYGGEEIAVILPETPLEGARVVADRLRASIASLRLTVPSGQAVSCTVSVGVAVVPEDADRRERLIDAADKALYLAKWTGRNCVKTYRDFLKFRQSSPV
ncbi:MAG: diguanylate cyclase [Nitrospirae bacterium]|nr:diguanylate cyclase [Nitrospirota bacterium]